MEEEKKKVQKLTMKVLLVLTAVIAAYIIYALVTKSLNIVIFEVLLALFVVIYLVMSDIIEPWKLGLFREMTIGFYDRIRCSSLGLSEKTHESNVNVTFT